jgi:hypothetical protein
VSLSEMPAGRAAVIPLTATGPPTPTRSACPMRPSTARRTPSRSRPAQPKRRSATTSGGTARRLGPPRPYAGHPAWLPTAVAPRRVGGREVVSRRRLLKRVAGAVAAGAGLAAAWAVVGTAPAAADHLPGFGHVNEVGTGATYSYTNNPLSALHSRIVALARPWSEPATLVMRSRASRNYAPGSSHQSILERRRRPGGQRVQRGVRAQWRHWQRCLRRAGEPREHGQRSPGHQKREGQLGVRVQAAGHSRRRRRRSGHQRTRRPGRQRHGTGLEGVSETGHALKVVGNAYFSRSGLQHRRGRVQRHGDLPSDGGTSIHATLQSNVADIWVRAVVPNPAAGDFTVHLKRATPVGVRAAWFAVH